LSPGALGAVYTLSEAGAAGALLTNYTTTYACTNALAGGQTPSGPRSEQSFDLDRPLREARDAFEKSYFEFHLAKEGGSMTRVAEKTGLERTHLYRKLKQLGVDLSRGKRGLA
jgi:DNA-binding NtrC family response regulator